jgi:hypothetical protein
MSNRSTRPPQRYNARDKVIALGAGQFVGLRESVLPLELAIDITR